MGMYPKMPGLRNPRAQDGYLACGRMGLSKTHLPEGSANRITYDSTPNEPTSKRSLFRIPGPMLLTGQARLGCINSFVAREGNQARRCRDETIAYSAAAGSARYSV